MLLPWCLRLTVGDNVPAGDAGCTSWPQWASAEWGAAIDGRDGRARSGGRAMQDGSARGDGHGGEAEWHGRTAA
jgi:hypothetical protein